MTVLNDRIEQKNLYRKYLINVDPEKNVGITFRIIEGSCLVQVMDSNAIM